MAKKKEDNAARRCEKLTVKFNQDYVASRGAGIAGAKGTEHEYPWSTDLQKLIEDEVVTVISKTTPDQRKKATSAEAAKRQTAAAK